MASSVLHDIVAAVKGLVGADAGHRALRDLDAILAKQPKADPDLFSRCTKDLVALRNELIVRSREPAHGDGVRAALAHVNAVISVVTAGHFPLGPVPWEELGKARAWLAKIVGHAA